MPSKWMVDAKGRGGEASNVAIREVLNDLNFESFIESQGSLASAVQSHIQANGYTASDRGGGDGSWHIGVPFDDVNQAFAYLVLMIEKFHRAIAAKMMRFELKTWSSSCWE